MEIGTVFDKLLTDVPSVKIVTIKDEKRPDITLMVKQFNYSENDNRNGIEDDRSSDSSVEETPAGDPICPVCGTL